MRRTVKAAIAAVGLTVIAVGSAATAAAEPGTPPSPSGEDVSSFGGFGDANFGGSLGADGYTASVGGTTVVSRGWPVSRSTVSGPWGSWDSTTNYDYEGGIEHWSTWRTENFDWDNWYELTPNEYAQESLTRVGSMQYRCINNVCTMVPAGTP